MCGQAGERLGSEVTVCIPARVSTAWHASGRQVRPLGLSDGIATDGPVRAVPPQARTPGRCLRRRAPPDECGASPCCAGTPAGPSPDATGQPNASGRGGALLCPHLLRRSWGPRPAWGRHAGLRHRRRRRSASGHHRLSVDVHPASPRRGAPPGRACRRSSAPQAKPSPAGHACSPDHPLRRARGPRRRGHPRPRPGRR